jgi:regulation of enolase protein 1 (concanavalin A-like superfamily)
MLLLRRPLLRLVLVGAALAISCLPAMAEEKPLFEEKFAGKLSAGWTWIDELPGTWQVTEDSLDLKVVPVGEGLWQAGRKHPNLLVRDPGTKGDYAVEVQLKSNPTAQFEHAGVILYADGDNYVVINKEMFAKSEVILVSEKGAKPETRQKPHEHEEVWLRLVVTGKKVTGQYRHYDSDPWLMLGELELPVPGPYKVGLFAGRPPKDADHRVRFSQFRILPVSVAGVTSNPPAKVADPEAPPPTVPVPAQVKRPIRTDVSLAVQARQTAERAIPYIEKDGTTWIKDRKCLSCHYVSFMVWSFHDASERGFAIDSAKLAEWTDWSMNHALGQGTEGAAQMLMTRDRTDQSEKTVKLIESLRDAVIKGQEKEGFWKPGGQLPAQKRPLSETTQVSTMWNLLALDTLDPPNEQWIESRDKAIEWLKKTPPNGKDPAVSAEWYAARLLVEKKFGDTKEVEVLRDKILAAQQSDGGWGWLWADKSDAFGTGVSLYALSQVGVPNSTPAIQKAWTHLIETQTDAGSWIVNGTKSATKDKPHPFSGFWGSTWALLGLSHSLADPATKTAGVGVGSTTASAGGDESKRAN